MKGKCRDCGGETDKEDYRRCHVCHSAHKAKREKMRDAIEIELTEAVSVWV